MAAQPVELVVNGGLMRGLRAHDRLLKVGAVFLREVRTAPLYRLWSIEDRFPGMLRHPDGAASTAAEMHAISGAGLAEVLEQEPAGLCIGRVVLEGGGTPLGVLAEPWLVEGRREITELGGWRAYLGLPARG